MNIAIVCYPTFGGSGIVATELGIQLATLGHKIHFVSYEQPVRLINFHSNIFFHEIYSYQYPLFDNIAPYESTMVSKLVDVVLNEKIDLIHVHYAIPHASAAYMVKKILENKGKYVPYVTTLHGTDITLVGKDKAYKPTVEFSINESDGITAVSNYLKQETLKSFDITKDIEVIYNFIDNDSINKTILVECCNNLKKENEKLLTHISNFRKVKRIEDIVNGFELVLQKLDAKLLLVGDGPERAPIENLVREKKLTSKVIFLGKHLNINQILCVSDIFILASDYESFGLSALEAMACGTPVVSTNTGGLSEVNMHGITGLTFDIGDVKQLANHCISILCDREKVKSLKKNCLIHAQKFDIKKIIPQYINLYNKILKND